MRRFIAIQATAIDCNHYGHYRYSLTRCCFHFPRFDRSLCLSSTDRTHRTPSTGRFQYSSATLVETALHATYIRNVSKQGQVLNQGVLATVPASLGKVMQERLTGAVPKHPRCTAPS